MAGLGKTPKTLNQQVETNCSCTWHLQFHICRRRDAGVHMHPYRCRCKDAGVEVQVRKFTRII